MVQKNLKPVFITGATTVAPENTFFKAITVLKLSAETDTISVKGGVSQGLDANDSDGSSHLNAKGTGTLPATHDAGIYEMLPTVAIAMNVPVGTTVYGRFTEVAVGTGDSVIAYL